MLQDTYVNEKLRELEAARLDRVLIFKAEASSLGKRRRTTKPVIGPVMKAAGRTLRWAGEGLEGWAAPRPTDGERRLEAERWTG